MMGPRTAVLALTLLVTMAPSPGTVTAMMMAMIPVLTHPLTLVFLPLTAPMVVVRMKRHRRLPEPAIPTMTAVTAMMTAALGMILPGILGMTTLLASTTVLGMMAAVEVIQETRRRERVLETHLPLTTGPIPNATMTAGSNSTVSGAKSKRSGARGGATMGWSATHVQAPPHRIATPTTGGESVSGTRS
jgi:hypothetical protein